MPLNCSRYGKIPSERYPCLLDLELKRLDFSLRNSAVNGKDSVYALALDWLGNTYRNHPMSAEFAFERASLLYGSEYDEQGYSDDNPRRWDRKKALGICSSTVKRINDSVETRNCKLLMNKIKKRDISVITEEVGIPGKPMKGLIKYKTRTMFISVFAGLTMIHTGPDTIR